MIATALREQAEGEGHSVDWAARLDVADDALATAQYDLILLDLMLPDGHGLPFLRKLRARGGQDPGHHHDSAGSGDGQDRRG